MAVEMKCTNIAWHEQKVQKDIRGEQKKQKPCIIWFTGLSGSGKSTLANALDLKLYGAGYHSYVLDGDNVRHGLNKDLGFSAQDRTENIRRIGEVAGLMVDAGLIVSCAFISPYRTDRQLVRSIVKGSEFFEIYVETAIEICERRDPKGLYKKARRGEIKGFTGIDAPYEVPESPELIINTENASIEQSVQNILSTLKEMGHIKQ